MIKPTQAVISKWKGIVADYSCIITRSSHIHIHHPVGRKYRIDKHEIGELFILPLAIHLHDVGSNHPLNVTLHRKAFVECYGRECDLFKKMCEKIGDLPFESFWIDLILKTGR